MKLPTFFDSRFLGWLNDAERSDVRYNAQKAAKVIFKQERPDHVVYEYISYKNNGNAEAAHFYSGLPFNNDDFEKKVASIPHAKIGAFHRGTCAI